MTSEVRQVTQERRGLRALFATVEGNARVLVITEGIAAISFQWIRTYMPLYMVALGVTEVQLGLLQSVLVFTQVISTLLGGTFADRFGRKRVLVVIDIICWGVPMFLYAIARNPWYFLVGRLINGFVYLVMPSFQCLFVEDVAVENRPAVFRMLQFLSSGAHLLAPMAGLLVVQIGLIPAGRTFAAVCMISSVSIALIRQFTLRETSTGEARIATTMGLTLGEWMRVYLVAVRTMFRQRRTRIFLLIRILVTFNTTMWATYSTIYLTAERGIGLTEAAVSIFPTVTALVTMGMVVVMARQAQTKEVFRQLILGQLLSVVASLLYVASPPGTLRWIALWAVVSAVSVALFQPASQSYWANIVGDRERALIFSAGSALTALCAVLAGPLAGVLYTRYARGPFLLGIGLQLAALALTWALQHREQPASTT